jgi:hypothetical protein
MSNKRLRRAGHGSPFPISDALLRHHLVPFLDPVSVVQAHRVWPSSILQNVTALVFDANVQRDRLVEAILERTDQLRRLEFHSRNIPPNAAATFDRFLPTLQVLKLLDVPSSDVLRVSALLSHPSFIQKTTALVVLEVATEANFLYTFNRMESYDFFETHPQLRELVLRHQSTYSLSLDVARMIKALQPSQLQRLDLSVTASDIHLRQIGNTLVSLKSLALRSSIQQSAGSWSVDALRNLWSKCKELDHLILAAAGQVRGDGDDLQLHWHRSERTFEVQRDGQRHPATKHQWKQIHAMWVHSPVQQWQRLHLVLDDDGTQTFLRAIDTPVSVRHLVLDVGTRPMAEQIDSKLLDHCDAKVLESLRVTTDINSVTYSPRTATLRTEKLTDDENVEWIRALPCKRVDLTASDGRETQLHQVMENAPLVQSVLLYEDYWWEWAAVTGHRPDSVTDRIQTLDLSGLRELVLWSASLSMTTYRRLAQQLGKTIQRLEIDVACDDTGDLFLQTDFERLHSENLTRLALHLRFAVDSYFSPVVSHRDCILPLLQRHKKLQWLSFRCAWMSWEEEKKPWLQSASLTTTTLLFDQPPAIHRSVLESTLQQCPALQSLVVASKTGSLQTSTSSRGSYIRAPAPFSRVSVVVCLFSNLVQTSPPGNWLALPDAMRVLDQRRLNEFEVAETAFDLPTVPLNASMAMTHDDDDDETMEDRVAAADEKQVNRQLAAQLHQGQEVRLERNTGASTVDALVMHPDLSLSLPMSSHASPDARRAIAAWNSSVSSK